MGERLLSMQDILSGKDRIVQVFIPALEGKVSIRALGLAEIAKAQGQAVESIKITADAPLEKGSVPGNAKLDFTMKGLIIAEAESQLMLAQMGLSCNGANWRLEDVKAIRPASAIKQIADEVLKVSGVDSEVAAQLQPFRELARRATTDESDRDGIQAD